MKNKFLKLMALFVASAFVGNAGAQTDVTSTYLENADFSQSTATTTDVYGYGKDGSPYGFQSVEGWSTKVLAGDNSNSQYPNSGMAGAVLSYGSNNLLRGNQKSAPSNAPEGSTSNNCLGFMAVWSLGGYYYQEVTLDPGKYTITIPVYNASGTQSNTSYIGFIPNEGTSYTMATNPTVGQWTTLTTSFVLSEKVSGKIALGYQSTGNGSGANPHLFFDCVKIEFTDLISGAKEAWDEAIQSANNALNDETYANVIGEERTALANEIAKTEPSTVDEYVTATETLNSALNAFTAAEADYNTLIATKDDAEAYTTAAWPYASEAKKTALDNAANVTPTSAADAVAKASSIVTAYRQFVESNGIAEGAADAVDYTNKLKGTDAAGSTEGWSIGTNQGQSYTDGNGKTTAKYFDGGWASNAGVNLDLNQNVTLPSGKYLLQITARGATGLDTYTMSVGESSVDLPKDGGAGGTFGNGWSDRYLVFESEGTELTINITAKSTATQQWISFNRIRLTQLEVYEELATEEEYKSLNEAIAAAEEKTLGFENGEYAPYNNIAALQALAKAKSVNQEVQNVKSEIEAVTSELTSAVWTANEGEVSAIDLSKLYDATNVDGNNRVYAPGWGKNGGTDAYNTRLVQGTSDNAGMAAVDGALALFTKYGTDYGKESGYTMPLKANTTYRLTFKYGAWGENKTIVSRFSVSDANGNTIEITPASFTYYQNSGLANEDVDAWFDYVGCFTTGEAGDYVLNMTKDNNGEQRQIVMGNINLVKAPVVEVAMNISDAQYSTFIAPFDVEIPEGVTASKITGAEGNVLTEEAVEGTIPANTPVVLYSENLVSKTFSGQSLATADAYTVGLLTGTYVDYQTTANTNTYVLQNNNGKVAFYLVGESAQPWIRANRCYMVYEAAAGAPMFSLERGEGTTSIEDAELTNETVVIYDLAGRRVEKMEKGIYIVNGKKVIR